MGDRTHHALSSLCRIISDLYGNGSQFSNLSSMTNKEKLLLSSCNTTGTIPDFISQISKLRHLEHSVNNLEDDIQTGTLLQDEQKIEFQFQ
ncbi:unnamed protein product [Lactuca virosa]|uniref:Uncharacterized protein n=1 Tax=Lactuca virosa TaxID=75947 RepID=A0AAU9ML12_9ASTR|nr:unnamed protein product [Lactuca virosa]